MNKKISEAKQDNSSSDSQTSDDVMADFQEPDELRKQLEYPARCKKRQLAVEHAERKLTERLEDINARLKEDKAKVSIQRVGDSLCLQATLPLKPGEARKDGKLSQQTKLSMGIPFNTDGLKTAEEEARELGRLKARGIFQWNEKYLRTKVAVPETQPTVSELLEQFEDKYFLTRRKDRQSLRTFKEHVRIMKLYLTQNKCLDKDTILEGIQKTSSGSGTRRNLVAALSILCNAFNFKFDFKGFKNGYIPKERILPDDNQIEARFHNFEIPKQRDNDQSKCWQWVYGILATYGLRPHEVFAIDIEAFINPANTLHELKLNESLTEGVKTGERTVFPWHPHWVELFDLKNVKMPLTIFHFKGRTEKIGNEFSTRKIGFKPYNLRHAYAVRGHKLGVPLKEMADNMGHSIEMHTKTYHKYMTIDTRRIVYQNAITKSNNAKVELTEIEQLRSENTALKAKNEQLEARMSEYQLDGVSSHNQ